VKAAGADRQRVRTACARNPSRYPLDTAVSGERSSPAEELVDRQRCRFDWPVLSRSTSGSSEGPDVRSSPRFFAVTSGT